MSLMLTSQELAVYGTVSLSWNQRQRSLQQLGGWRWNGMCAQQCVSQPICLPTYLHRHRAVQTFEHSTSTVTFGHAPSPLNTLVQSEIFQLRVSVDFIVFWDLSVVDANKEANLQLRSDAWMRADSNTLLVAPQLASASWNFITYILKVLCSHLITNYARSKEKSNNVKYVTYESMHCSKDHYKSLLTVCIGYKNMFLLGSTCLCSLSCIPLSLLSPADPECHPSPSVSPPGDHIPMFNCSEAFTVSQTKMTQRPFRLESKSNNVVASVCLQPFKDPFMTGA